MKGGKNRQPLGYTIVEVMVVLAVSGVMFVIAAGFINGKQQRAAFTSGVNGMASQVQNVIEQVTDGKYSDIPLNCNANASGPHPTLGSSQQGTNSECVFLGKLLRFDSNSPDYTISSLAGIRSTGDSTPSFSPGPGGVQPTIITDLDTSQTVPQSLEVTNVSVTDAITHSQGSYYVFGFAQSLGSSDGSFQSGGQTVSLIYAKVGPNAAESAINNHIDYAESITLCLSDGNRQAKLVLGGNSSQLNVDVQHLSGGAPCP
jgi:prepilin-type N-terminal cleavage/methylation domain-containing protein